METHTREHGSLDTRSQDPDRMSCPSHAPAVLHLSGILDGERCAWSLADPVVAIGRTPSSAVRIEDATVSKSHAEIVRRGGAWFVRDLESRNGTRVNGVRIEGEVQIKPGDQVAFGQVSLRATIGDADAPLRLSDSHDLTTTLRVSAKQVLRSQARARTDEARLVQLFAEAGKLLVLPRPVQDLGDEILQIVAKAIPASRLILLLNGEGESEPVQVAARSSGGTSQEPLVLSRAILRHVLDGCSSVITADAMTDPRFMTSASVILHRVRSAMAVPLFDSQRVLGLLYADHNDPAVSFSQEQLEILTLFANMAAVKIANVQLLQAEQLVLKLEQELAAAARIQRHLLPDSCGEIQGYACHARLEPCYEVGGDFYDIHPMPDGTIYVVLGDVAGKGLCAALLMASALASLRALYEHCADPGMLASRLSDALWRHTEPNRFVTAFIARLEPSTGEVQYVNAGHPLPLLIGRGAVRTLPSTGAPLGVLPGLKFDIGTAALDPGEVLALYTDGIPDARRGREFFGTERVAGALADAGASGDLERQADGVFDRVGAFNAGGPRGDDMAILLLRRGDHAGAVTVERSMS